MNESKSQVLLKHHLKALRLPVFLREYEKIAAKNAKEKGNFKSFLLELSENLKRAKYAGTEKQLLKGKNIALIFEKTSTRTRCAFEVAAYDQGAHVTYLGPTGSQIGHKETMKDTARVLGRMYDGIEYRGFGQKVVEELGQYAGVPVWNGLQQNFIPLKFWLIFLLQRNI